MVICRFMKRILPESSTEQIEENQTHYIKKDSILFVPSHDEGEYTPVILTALPVPADARTRWLCAAMAMIMF